MSEIDITLTIILVASCLITYIIGSIFGRYRGYKQGIQVGIDYMTAQYHKEAEKIINNFKTNNVDFDMDGYNKIIDEIVDIHELLEVTTDKEEIARLNNKIGELQKKASLMFGDN